MVQVPHNFSPRDYQLDLFMAMDGIKGKPGSNKKRAMLRWHRRAGKDKACFCYLIKEAAQTPGNYFYVFPTKTMARQALWENIDKDGFKLLDHIPSVVIKRKSNQEMLVELTNGSTIRILGYDKDPDSIRGIAARGAVFSEFAFTDPESYKNMIPALRESDGWVIFNSTPNGRNHFYEMWKNVLNSPRWYCSMLQTMYPDKPGYSGLVAKEDIPHIKEEEGLTTEDVEREYGVSFNSGMQGSFYAEQIEDAYNKGRVSEFAYDDNLKVDTFWDLGVDDSTAVWFRQKVGNKSVFIDYYEENNKDLKHYAKVLENKGYEYDTHFLPHDAQQRSLQTGFSTADMFEDILKNLNISGMVEVLPRLGVQDGIQAVRAKFSRYYFDAAKCLEGLKKLEMYHRRYDNKRKVFLKEPVHDANSHSADAMRMEAISEDIRADRVRRNEDIKVLSEYDLWST